MNSSSGCTLADCTNKVYEPARCVRSNRRCCPRASRRERRRNRPSSRRASSFRRGAHRGCSSRLAGMMVMRPRQLLAEAMPVGVAADGGQSDRTAPEAMGSRRVGLASPPPTGSGVAATSWSRGGTGGKGAASGATVPAKMKMTETAKLGRRQLHGRNPRASERLNPCCGDCASTRQLPHVGQSLRTSAFAQQRISRPQESRITAQSSFHFRKTPSIRTAYLRPCR